MGKWESRSDFHGRWARRKTVSGFPRRPPTVISTAVRLTHSVAYDGMMEALRRLRRQHTNCRVLVLAMYEADDSAQRALQAGADGIVLKGVAHGDLLQAIRTVHAAAD